MTNVFVREVPVGSQSILVKLDLITGEQEEPLAEGSHQHIHGMAVTKLAADLAFGHHLEATYKENCQPEDRMP